MEDRFPDIEISPIETAYGAFDFYCFSWGRHEEDNILCATKTASEHRPLVRVQSACYTAEIFRSTDCDCHAQLDISLRRVAAEGGAVIYMLCDGRGAGLLSKVRGLALGNQQGLDTSDAYKAMGIPEDAREYHRAAVVLRHIGLTSLRLLTNNPRKLNGLIREGLDVQREPLEVPSTPESRPYLSTKARKMGHMLSEFTKGTYTSKQATP
jgi:GTP cyclohydrolase II